MATLFAVSEAAAAVAVVAAEGTTDIVTIGDKGRAQLQRVAPDQIKLSIADTYKERVTFSQVRSSSSVSISRGHLLVGS